MGICESHFHKIFVETAMQAEQDALIEHPSGEGRGPKQNVCNHMKLVLYASSTSRDVPMHS